MSTTEAAAPPCAAPPPPPPPPLPGTQGAVDVPTYKEIKEKNDEAKKADAAKSSIQDSQFANLPDKLMNTMKREKKPFTYTPLSVGDNGKLDLSQIKSPKMKKRLMANLKDEEEQDENRVESIDASIQNHKNQDELDKELSSPIPILKKPITEPDFSPSVQTKPSLFVPLSALSDNYSNDSYQINGSNYQPPLPQRQTSSNYDFNRPLSPDEKLDQILSEQLNRGLTDQNNNYATSFYDQNNASHTSKPQQQYYGNIKPKKVNIAQELYDDRNFNCLPSQYISPTATGTGEHTGNQINYNQSPKQWSNTNSTTPSSSYTIPIQIENNNQSRYYSNPQLNNYQNNSYDRPQSSQSSKSYQIPIINQNKATNIAPPPPPQRQQSLNRTYQTEKEIPIDYEEPIQSRSFKILQKLTADIEDEIDKLRVLDEQNKSTYQRDPLEDKLPAYFGTLNHIEQPRLRSERRVPIEVENNNSHTYSQPEYHSRSEQNWYSNQNNITSSSLNSDLLSSSNPWSSPVDWTPQIPASRQPQLANPSRYQGSNIPSRTFRFLQMLSGENDW